MEKLTKVLLGIIIFIICIVSIISVRFAIYSSPYKITPEKAQLEDAILKFINRTTVVANTIDIKQELNLDNKKYVLIAFGNREGEVEFIKGINKKYKIGSAGYGTSIFRSDIRKTNKGKYIFIICKNHNKNIQYANVLLESKEYKIDIPKEEYVIAYYKVPNNTQVKIIDINNIKFYSDDNIDITQEVLFNQ